MDNHKLPNTAAPMAAEAETHLLDYLNVVLRRWKVALAVFVLVFGGVAVKTYLTPPVYEAYATLEVRKNSKGGVLGEKITGVGDNSLAADIELLRSRSMAEEVGRRLHVDSGMIMGGIRAAEAGRGTNILRLSFQSTDPVEARDIVNAMAQVYHDQSIASKTREAGKTVDFITEQLGSLKTTLDQTEQALQEYKVETGLMALGPEGSKVVEKLVGFEQQRAEVGLRRKRLEYAIQTVRTALRQGRSVNPPPVDGVPLSIETGAKIAQLEAEKKALLVDFTEAHPAVVNIQQQISRALETLLNAYEAGLQNLALEEKDLGGKIVENERQLDGIPKAELELAKRTRVNNVNAELYTFLLQKQQETRIAQASTLSNVEIIDQAFTPQAPIKPNKKKNLMLGLVLGLMVGVGSAFFLDYLDDTVKDADEVRGHLGLPVLGIIPRITSGSDDPASMLVGRLAPKSAPVEAFRALRTGLHFAAAREKRKILMVTSSFPNEGKTTISANLAVVLAQTGARVLLLGCDLRRPGLYDMLGTENTPGLSDLLVANAKDYVRRIPGTSLDLISAGTVPPNPAELLGSERMKKFLAFIRERYDHIVIDAPPVLPVTDAQILGALVDDVLIVLEPCRVPRKAAVRMVETLRAVDAKIIGVALNDKAGKGFKYYGNYGYYGHKYYGGYYGETEKAKAGARG